MRKQLAARSNIGIGMNPASFMRVLTVLTAWLTKKHNSKRLGKTCGREATNQCQAGNQSE